MHVGQIWPNGHELTISDIDNIFLKEFKILPLSIYCTMSFCFFLLIQH